MWKRLQDGLSRTSKHFSELFFKALGKDPLSKEKLSELEDALLLADVGPHWAEKLSAEILKENPENLGKSLAQHIERLLTPYESPIPNCPIIVAMGVNGSGKTTTLGKLIGYFLAQKKRVHVVSGDTFRAAAAQQLQGWVNRYESFCNGHSLVVTEGSTEPASLIFQAIEKERQWHNNPFWPILASPDSTSPLESVILVDTAGRLPNNINLMNELKKIGTVLQKIGEKTLSQMQNLPQDQKQGYNFLKQDTRFWSTVLCLDGTSGQNTLSQVEIFGKSLPVNSLIITKMDGSCRGGFLIPLAHKHKIPICALGIGEKIQDLCLFSGKKYAQALVGIL